MAYKTIWEIEVRHDGLGKYRHIRGSDKYVVEQKASYQKLQWDEQWQRKLEADHRAQERRLAAEQKERLREQVASEKERLKAEAQRYKDERNQGAIDRDAEAKAAIEVLKNILHQTLRVNDAIDWNQLKDTTTFKESPPKLELPPPPENRPLPTAPTLDVVPLKPVPAVRSNSPDAAKYQPVLGFLDHLFPSRKARKLEEAEALFQKDHARWVEECKRFDDQDDSELQKWEHKKKVVENRNAAFCADWERSIERTRKEDTDSWSWWEKNCEQVRDKHSEAMKEWAQRKDKFYARQKESSAAIDQNHENYMARDQGAIADYCDSVLSNSSYPDYFQKELDLDYNADTRTVVVEYDLPSPESLPTLKDVQYVQSKDEFKETHLSERERDSLYDSLLYQIALRTIHELFEADTADALDAVVFNGIVTAKDKTTGRNITACVLSVLARKEPFMHINLAGIDPKACFKSLKGVAASRLSGLSPIPPVMMIDKNDRRFVAGYRIADYINESTNLAAMDWEDFEHLIREVFEQEFVSGGGEVKVTQASRDGGVDAVAFDPDPIRGGKIVIQAKRYTNTVGVSAVRDLYGTVMNEGATKGILVTTADYGPDAYEFAKGKPLTLLSGSNLLHLLEKHGHQARINLREARQEDKQKL
ncbi:MAG: hypothetical protein A2521_00730 [Deltaproteobacteria bacterium RIFOXYD12_FULL_57_12]|nr:MAG: hypothetical protein A2521_00730 [Deltaproteobacteria bacterium RIFOXYD12_FULL_57_12]